MTLRRRIMCANVIGLQAGTGNVQIFEGMPGNGEKGATAGSPLFDKGWHLVPTHVQIFVCFLAALLLANVVRICVTELYGDLRQLHIAIGKWRNARRTIQTQRAHVVAKNRGS